MTFKNDNQEPKHHITPGLYKNDPPIIIAGLGRCGTTLLTFAISVTRNNPAVMAIDLNKTEFSDGIIYKNS